MGYLQERGRDFGTLHGLGADAPTSPSLVLVRNYPGVGWASYQSPVTDQTIRAMQGEAVRSGYAPGLTADGIVSSATVSALRVIARMMAARPGAKSTLLSTFSLVGNRIDLTASALLALASSAQLVAEHAGVVYNYLKAMNDAVARPPMPYPPLRSSPPVPEAQAAVAVPPLPVPGPGGGSLMDTLKSPLGLAAVAVGALLLYTSTRRGRRSRRR